MSLTEHLSVLCDPRRKAGLRTSLPQILSMAVLGYLCGSTGYRPLQRFCELYADTFIEALSLRHGIPSHVTFRSVLQALDQEALIAAFNGWAKSVIKLEAGDWVSSDGKTLNSTVSNCHQSSQDFEAVVSLFGQRSGLIYAVEHYRNKSKEKAETDVVRFLIDQLQGMGVTLTVDALHTQKKR